MMRPVVQALYENREYRFWVCQCAGWAGYSLLSFLSITLNDPQPGWSHVARVAIQAGLGVLLSWLLRPVYRATFHRPVPIRVLVALPAVFIVSGLWTAARMLSYAWISGETPPWRDFNYQYLVSLFVFLSWTVLYYGISYYELFISERQRRLEETAQKEAERSRRLRAEALAREAQLRMLRYQLNPHFLFNTLNSISALVKISDGQKAVEMIQLLGRFLRSMLEQDGAAEVCLDQELDSLMLYLDIEKVRFQDRLRLEFSIEDKARRAWVPSLILQPLVENSMKYAIARSEDGGTVRLEASVAGDQLRLQVSDTGPGIEDLAGDPGRGVGLRNTVERLGALYQNNYTFSVTNIDPAGLAVQIRIPYLTGVEQAQSEGIS